VNQTCDGRYNPAGVTRVPKSVEARRQILSTPDHVGWQAINLSTFFSRFNQETFYEPDGDHFFN
jgi:hypothetical protein